jgi:hypothetical protein
VLIDREQLSAARAAFNPGGGINLAGLLASLSDDGEGTDNDSIVVNSNDYDSLDGGNGSDVDYEEGVWLMVRGLVEYVVVFTKGLRVYFNLCACLYILTNTHRVIQTGLSGICCCVY